MGLTEEERLNANALLFITARTQSDNKVDQIIKLLEAGANINAVDANYRNHTVLHVATLRGEADIVKLLLEKKARVNTVNNDNKTPLDIALSSDKEAKQEIIDLLIKSGAISRVNTNNAVPETKQQKQAKFNYDNNTLVFQKRAGTSGASGQLYESKLLCLVFIRAMYADVISDFYLGTNIDGIGALDDICLKYNIPGRPPIMLFLQAKHREDPDKGKVTVNDLLSPNGNFREMNERREFEREMKKRDESMNERCMKMEKELYSKMEEQGRMIKESSEKIDRFHDLLESRKGVPEGTTYASVAAGRAKAPTQAALHSVVVSSRDIDDSGNEVLEQIREAVKAKDGWVRIERVRKAKGKKIILGCENEEERMKVKERLREAKKLVVEDIKNKDPLLVHRDVLLLNEDQEIANALRNQNRGIFNDLRKEDDRLEFCFRRRSANPLASHVVMRVSPAIWSRMVGAGAVHVDLQRVKVADHSPLVQCSICLGYGHGRRFCTETVAKCSHCGGPHMRDKCAYYLASVAPSCCNCTRAKLEQTEHNAFSQDCPVRRKWDALARSSIAYN